jgi:hypothetical protein
MVDSADARLVAAESSLNGVTGKRATARLLAAGGHS